MTDCSASRVDHTTGTHIHAHMLCEDKLKMVSGITIAGWSVAAAACSFFKLF